jgi:hypothetical protein
MKVNGGADVLIQVFLNSALVGGEISPSTHWIGGWVDPRASLDDMENLKFLTPPGLKL